jgi:heme exporter protein A
MSFAGRGLTCIRGDRLVFQNLDFEVAPGSALVLEGPNGSGKSSLLRVVSGLLGAAAGELTWQGRPISEDAEGHRARLHYVGHQDAVKPVFTVAENLRFWATMHGGDFPEGGIAGALERLAIDHLADLPARLLSAGQRRRLNLARIVASWAPLWLLDEPTTSLDAASSAMVRDLVAEHCAAGGLVMMATHLSLDLPTASVLRMERFAPAVLDDDEAAA